MRPMPRRPAKTRKGRPRLPKRDEHQLLVRDADATLRALSAWAVDTGIPATAAVRRVLAWLVEQESAPAWLTDSMPAPGPRALPFMAPPAVVERAGAWGKVRGVTQASMLRAIVRAIVGGKVLVSILVTDEGEKNRPA